MPPVKTVDGVTTYTTTRRNKNVNVDKIKHIYIYCIGTFQQNQSLHIKKNAVHNIYRLASGPMLVWLSGNCPACPCVKKALSGIRRVNLVTNLELNVRNINIIRILLSRSGKFIMAKLKSLPFVIESGRKLTICVKFEEKTVYRNLAW